MMTTAQPGTHIATRPHAGKLMIRRVLKEPLLHFFVLGTAIFILYGLFFDSDGLQGAHVKQPCVYMLASKRNGTIYIGVTSNLALRIWQHKEDVADGFTSRYAVHDLVWYELHEMMETAIAREKAMKAWKRAWKIARITKQNPAWRDLYPDILGLDSGLRQNDGTVNAAVK